MEGGYLMINLADNELFQRLQIGKDLGKPILVRDGNQNFFIDRITGGNPIYDEDDILTGYSDIVLLSANGSITITDANVVTKTDLDNVINPLMENIKDASGNLRFIEGIGANSSRINNPYCKWSLSGTHLMLVIAGDVTNGTELNNGDIIARFTLPQWIFDKIFPIFATNNLEIKNCVFYANDYTTQSSNVILAKSNDTDIVILKGANTTMNADRAFRLQFDLLIDNEDGE